VTFVSLPTDGCRDPTPRRSSSGKGNRTSQPLTSLEMTDLSRQGMRFDSSVDGKRKSAAWFAAEWERSRRKETNRPNAARALNTKISVICCRSSADDHFRPASEAGPAGAGSSRLRLIHDTPGVYDGLRFGGSAVVTGIRNPGSTRVLCSASDVN